MKTNKFIPTSRSEWKEGKFPEGHSEELIANRIRNLKQIQAGKVPDMCKGYYKQGFQEGRQATCNKIIEIVENMFLIDKYQESFSKDMINRIKGVRDK